MSRVGFAGDQEPRSAFHTVVGGTKYCCDFPRDFAGDDAWSREGILLLKHPVKNGVVTDWESMKKLWIHTFDQALKVDSSEHPVLVTESPLNPKPNSEKMVSVLFETFQVPSLSIGMQAVLSLYAAGLTTGLVLDSGDSLSPDGLVKEALGRARLPVHHPLGA
jgi:actin